MSEVNWAELNRRLDEPLELSDALLLVEKLGLEPSLFPANPSLRSVVEAANLPLGSVARLMESNWRETFPELGQNTEAAPPDSQTVWDAEAMGEAWEEMPVREEIASPSVQEQVDDGLIKDQAAWLATKFGLASTPHEGASVESVARANDLDPEILRDSLSLLSGNTHRRARRKAKGRLVDLDNPKDVSAIYEAVRDEYIWRSIKVALIFIVILAIAAIIYSAMPKG